MAQTELALEYFDRGFNCAQAVLVAFADQQGVERETAFRVAGAFGGGMARMGLTCGAVTGAMMALGLQYGMVDAADPEAKLRTYAMASACTARFRERHGTITCRELIDCDLSTPEGRELANQRQTHQKICRGLIIDAIAIAEELIAARDATPDPNA